MATTTSNDSLTEVEQQMRDFAASLNEKDRRRFVALQARQHGHGGIAYVVKVVGCSRHTIERGMKELGHLGSSSAAYREKERR